MQCATLGGGPFGVRLPETSSHPFLLINLLPNDKIKSHTIITTNAAPHLHLFQVVQ